MHVIGTAGHVDHGKSALVAALTGTHPDRLKEEQEREMTIDLGFAWLTLPDGAPVGIVDVPGHRDFIENMLAGVGGIDAALFVVAADEGVMPQTREHLAILDLLQVQSGVVALTKTDLVQDADWLDLVEEDVRQALRGSVLENAPLVRVSARKRTGLEELLKALSDCLANTQPRPDLGRPRLPVDRVFSISGFGTVVTGTLIDGCFRTGDEVEVLPTGKRGRIRGLQTHKQKEEIAFPGSRTAVNISGVDLPEVQRGYVLAIPGKYRPTQRIDVHFRLLKDAAGPLKHSAEVKLFLGASEVLARARLLGVEQILPGEQGWLQFELRQPVVAVRGDRYILRRPSPGETLGGGIVVDPQPAGRHKRFDAEVLRGLDALRQGSPADVLLQASLALGAAPLAQVVARSRLASRQAEAAIAELIQNGQLQLLEEGRLEADSDLLVMPTGLWEQEAKRALQELDAFHKAYPLRSGMPREALKSRSKMSTRVFNAALHHLAQLGSVVERGSVTVRAGFQVTFSAQQAERVARLLRRFELEPNAPPSYKDSMAEVGEDVLDVLLERGDLVLVSEDVLFRKADYERLVQAVIAYLQEHGTLTVAEFRDLSNTSRKYALALLEHLDAEKITVREGDFRRLQNIPNR
ncbi:selenocysteine-specific translation elongation factor SelB [Longilinea arvoryzae]|uniref:Selenocysteine-specific elongation factor n=1 Tax=Longilinea arvoryzae TaxID=360412 RepID=A0A0S7BI88_9CHLR|nr:selenocysteine-specific translation elongation factor [Longilinea arvoryzae]GAP14198.1 selenocysteine-specific translation elongation factor SelB [Longilinea arvoryzae]